MFTIDILQWRNIKDILFTAMNATMLLILSFILFPFLILIVPVPFIILFLKRSYRESLIAILIQFFLLLVLLDVQLAIISVTFTVILVFSIGFLIEDNQKNQNIVFWSTLGCVLFTTISYFTIKYYYKADLLLAFKENLYAIIELNPIEVVGSIEIAKMLRETAEMILKIFPSMLVLAFTLSSYLNLTIALHNVAKSNSSLDNENQRNIHLKDRKIPYLKTIHFSYHWSIAAAIIVGLLYVLAYTGRFNNEELLLNIVFFFSSIYLFNGLAIGDYFLRNKKMFIRILIPVAFNLLGWSIFYIVLGVLDSIIDFRKRGKFKNEKV